MGPIHVLETGGWLRTYAKVGPKAGSVGGGTALAGQGRSEGWRGFAADAPTICPTGGLARVFGQWVRRARMGQFPHVYTIPRGRACKRDVGRLADWPTVILVHCPGSPVPADPARARARGRGSVPAPNGPRQTRIGLTARRRRAGSSRYARSRATCRRPHKPTSRKVARSNQRQAAASARS